MKYTAQQADSLSHAMELIASGATQIISRIPLCDLISRAALVRNGLFDFDGTLTPGSQWRAVSSLMPDDLRRIDLENYSWYHRHIHNQDVSDEVTLDDPDWWIDHLETGNKLAVDGAWVATAIHMFSLAGITREQIDLTATSLPPRAGVAELFRLMEQRAVVSFGIEQFIQAWLRHNGLTAPVAASRILFDSHGRVDRPHINIVGAGSKEFAAARFRRVTRVQNHELLITGDTVVDVHMMDNDTFNVLVIPPSELDRKMRDFRENNLAAMWDRVTMILADDSLEPLVQLLQDARKSSP